MEKFFDSVVIQQFMAGSFAGLFGVVMSHPIDTIKTRIQSGVSQNIKSAIQMRNFYSGIKSPLFGVPLEKSIVFGFYNLSKKYNINDFVSGIIGGFMSTLIVTPVEYIKINLQNNVKFQNIPFRNMYNGFIPTICRETPGFGIYFTTYNYLNKNYNLNKSYMLNFIYGGVSGLGAWIFIYPADLIKTIQQDVNNKKSIINNIKTIYNNSGVLGFYKGFNYAAVRAVVLHANVFLGYEIFNRFVY
jgi:solute carrier family 25 carnitine/acylcarnitine transporter 20/29